MRAACPCIVYRRTHRCKTGSRLGTRVLEELAEDSVGNTSQRVERPEHTEPYKRLVRRRVRAKARACKRDNVRGGSQARQMAADVQYTRADCEFETKGEKPLAQGSPTFGMTHVEHPASGHQSQGEGRPAFGHQNQE